MDAGSPFLSGVGGHADTLKFSPEKGVSGVPGFAFLEDVWVSIPTGGLGSGCPPCPQGLLEHQVLSGGGAEVPVPPDGV